MNLRYLRTFVAVVDDGGVARAAAKLNLSQPAASRQINALEAELGVLLFDRIRRHLQLTSEGKDLLWRSRRLLTEAASLGERANALKSGEAGVVRVGAPPHVIETVLAAFLAQYRHRHPLVEVHLVEDGGARLAGRLEQGEVQLALFANDAERFPGRPLYPIHILVVLPDGHRLSRRPVLEISDLVEEPIVLLKRGFGSREYFEQACRVARIQPRVLLESGAPHTVVALAAAGYGLAITPSNAKITRSGIRALPLVHRGVPIGAWSMVAWDPQRFLAPYTAQFVNELVAFSRRNYPNRDLTRRAPPLPKPKETKSHASKGTAR
jgi:LysR family transcriptional regulator, cyn operon transcriptional activator